MTPDQYTAPKVRSARRWSAPFTALGCLIVLAETHSWWTFTRVQTDLELQDTENQALANQFAQALHHVLASADRILYVAMVIVAAAGLAGAVHPVRRAPLYLSVLTVAALVLLWWVARADVTLIHDAGHLRPMR